MSAYVQTVVGSDSPPIGAVMDFAGNVEPSGWLFCFGQSLPRTGIYAQLFSVIGTLYGSVDGSSFSLPDFRGRVGAGRDNMGGTAASRLTTAWGVDGAVLGANGGAESHLLTIAQMPAHTHSNPQIGLGQAGGTGLGTWQNIASALTTGSTGGGVAHPNVQPTFIVNKIIKYSVSGTVLPIVPGEGDVVGPDGGVADGDLVVFNGTSGKIIRSGGARFSRGHLSGLQIANNVTDATNDIDIGEGECRDSTNSMDIKLSAGITKQLDVAWAVGNNTGGLDTGAIANVTYHVFAIRRADTGVVDALFSTSATAPTLPANYTHFRRIASIRRVSAAIVVFQQLGDNFNTVSFLDYNSTSARASALLAMSVPLGIICRPVFIPHMNKGTAGDAYMNIGDATGTGSGGSICVRVSAAGERDTSFVNSCITNTSAQITVAVTIPTGTVAECVIRTIGWIDRRGQDD
jgi:microcystin-dependent protein